MATSRKYIENFLEGIELFGVRVRPMMGDYVVYCMDKTVGCICDERLFIKITSASSALLEGAPKLPPYVGASERYLVENGDKKFLAELFKAIAAEVREKSANESTT